MRRTGLGGLCSMLLFFGSLSLLLCGCGKVGPPDDYYTQVLDMEEQGEKIRSDTGRRPGEIVAPVIESEPVRTASVPESQVTPEESQQQSEETPAVQQKEQIQERIPRREIVQELPSEPIAIKPDVIENALNASGLKISVRTVELMNGRLSGGKNFVRIYFIPESVNVINDRFGAICAVLYYLNTDTNTIDVVAGIAEDKQSNLLAIRQSSMDNIAAWMTDEITRAEWYSKITK